MSDDATRLGVTYGLPVLLPSKLWSVVRAAAVFAGAHLLLPPVKGVLGNDTTTFDEADTEVGDV